MSTVSVALPPVLVAVMVYVVKSEITVGVPLSSPVDGSRVRPAVSYTHLTLPTICSV